MYSGYPMIDVVTMTGNSIELLRRLRYCIYYSASQNIASKNDYLLVVMT